MHYFDSKNEYAHTTKPVVIQPYRYLSNWGLGTAVCFVLSSVFFCVFLTGRNGNWRFESVLNKAQVLGKGTVSHLFISNAPSIAKVLSRRNTSHQITLQNPHHCLQHITRRVGKWGWMKWEVRPSKRGIPGSRRSMRVYMLTYSRLRSSGILAEGDPNFCVRNTPERG